MNRSKDKRKKLGHWSFAFSWLYYTFYLLVIMVASYFLGTKPYVWGLPRWVALGNIVVPTVFVILLIFITEKIIPDTSLIDNEDKRDKE